MAFSRQALEALLDLVDNRIDAFHIHDTEDARELDLLEQTRVELRAMLGVRVAPPRLAQVIPLFAHAVPGY